METRTNTSLFRQAIQSWHKNRPIMTAASLSYFTLFSLIPTMVIVLKLVGEVFETMVAKTKLLEDIASWFNPQVATTVQTLLFAAEKASAKATTFTLLLLLWSAIRMFTQIQDALNVIWKANLPKGPRRWLWSRFRAVLMIAVFSIVVFAFLALDITFALLKKQLVIFFPAVIIKGVIPITGSILAFGLFTVLFAMLFKLLPDKRIPWKNVWVGAMGSSLLFGFARYVLTFYFLHSPIVSLYGAAGSVIVLLIWIYFSMQIFLLGAEFTHAYAEISMSRRRGEPLI